MESITPSTPQRRKPRGDVLNGRPVDRLPPHSPEAEQGALGCLLLSGGNGELARTEERIGRSGDAFYDLRNQTIYKAMVDLHDRKVMVDVISLQQQLKDHQNLEQVGGIAYLASLPDVVPSAANLSYYLDILVQKLVLRKVIHVCTETVGRVFEFEGEVESLTTQLQRDLTNLVKPIYAPTAQEHWALEDLAGYDVLRDPNAVIGWHDGKATRYLCKGYGAWIIGQSGIGKSSFGLQTCFNWATGRPFCNITPVPGRQLRILIVQSENDKGDCAEAAQGILDCSDFSAQEIDALRANVKVIRCRGKTGLDFCRWLEREILAWQADICYIDPLIRYAGIDVSRQDQCTNFLNNCLDPVLANTGAIIFGAHHTGKPKAKNDTKGFTIYDRAYAGIGSSELVNWARAIVILEARDDGTFEGTLAKRGGRAWATHPGETESTNTIYLAHDADRIFWRQIPPPSVPEKGPRSSDLKGRPSKVLEVSTMNLHDFCSKCVVEGEGLNQIAKRLESHLAGQKHDISTATAKRVIPALVANGKLTKREDGLYVKGPEA